MILTTSQKRIQNRREAVRNAYINKGEILTSSLVKSLANKLGVSDVTIWSDLTLQGLYVKEKKA